MRKPITCLIVVIAWMCLGLPPALHAQSMTFEQKYAEARANAATRAGRAYGIRLVAATRVHSEISSRDCTQDERRSPLHGYFDFASASHYRVILMPKTIFAKCVIAALENRKLPRPPHIPYLYPLDIELGE